MIKKTPFYDKHLQFNGRIVEFANHYLPLQFKPIIEEHKRVRTTVGVFDVSHMGRIEVRGKDAVKFVDYLTTNDVSGLAEYQVQYSTMCIENGGIVDDLLVYRLPEYVYLVVNGARREEDLKWIYQNKWPGIEVVDRTFEVCQLAIQGPKAEAVMQKICDIDLSKIGFYWSARCKIDNIPTLISRTGYTGEDGFEVYLENKYADKIWDMIFAVGKEFAIEPIGLGARDTLRLEMKYCLYGNDITLETNPLEAGLNFVVKLDKANGFIGQSALQKIKTEGVKRKLIGLEMLDNAIPRHGYNVLANGKVVGQITSGTLGPSVQKGIGMAYLPTGLAAVGTEIEVDIRNKISKAKVVKTTFYKLGTRK
ncbi:MAG: glycine cleavage system aminomethyltransferase GcvT [candidate division WOR-3 bacterium]